MKANGGIITAEDLRTYEPTIRKPLRGNVSRPRDHHHAAAVLGRIALLEMLNMLEPYDLKSMGWHSSRHVHTLIEVMRRALRRPRRVPRRHGLREGPGERARLARVRGRAAQAIDPERARRAKARRRRTGVRRDTTHYTIVDADGNVVCNTYTLNDSYGSGATVAAAASCSTTRWTTSRRVPACRTTTS
jgi:gamma-glutamyltranspeptidase/glutathione hydrolase